MASKPPSMQMPTQQGKFIKQKIMWHKGHQHNQQSQLLINKFEST